ncbi:hypothetical protein A9Q84_09620 [Halobacteriovorax marinus]|uniref:Peptidase M14 domain-containing protein n=1 Tax=Halobacteriovorax marinus TaxID=97084 RepID=A0A1Y5F774_9BACT|nr:hypothetical protein A9Q84_09620 [Halobacteriovorax marinus]
MIKQILLTFLMSCFLFQAQAANLAEVGFFVNDTNRSFLKTIHAQGKFIVDHPSSKGYEVYGPKGLKKWLTANSPVSFRSLSNSIDKRNSLLSYPSPEQIESRLIALQKKYPKILKLISIGKTETGRDLWVMKISDNVNVDEVEPEFKYVANMHGDEIVGRELMVSLIDELASKYSKNDQEITTLVNNTEIFIMPSLNPDGAAKRRRGNSNWRDLNRDFPDVERDARAFDFTENTTANRELETVAMMEFQNRRHFALSANFHGGTEVVNYPWDTKSSDFPYMNLVIDLSREYAASIPSMRDNREFIDGIVNGYDWYEINGGMQDWSYHWHNDLQVTIELSHSKWPSYSQVPGYYKKNRASLIKYMQRVHQGFGFKLDSPKKGRVTIKNFRGNSFQLLESLDFEGSEFYKVLAPGKYLIELESGSKKYSFEKEIRADDIKENGAFKSIQL